MDPNVQKAHFYRRASWGATQAELDTNTPPKELLERWLQDSRPVAALPPLAPPIAYGKEKNLNQEERMAARKKLREQGLEVATALVNQMVTAPNPLHETVTNFWRDHFIVSVKKLNLPHFLVDYDQRLRANALGDFRELLWSVTTSPAMMLYLDNQQNRVGKINENYSREVMELFTLGRGNYTEQDVQEGARALTGWSINREALISTGLVESMFVPNRHDTGSKIYLGQTGSLKAEDVVDILASHPSTAQTLSAKLWTAFVYPNPEPEIVKRLAVVYTRQNRSIAAVVEAIFNSPEFYSPKAYRSQLKGPMEFLLGSLRQLEIKAEYRRVLQALRSMGQLPYSAPSVKGWPSGAGWLDTTALLSRLSLAQKMTQDYGDEGAFVFNPGSYTPAELLRLLVDNKGSDSLIQSANGLSTREAAALILSSPTYQLA